jgi:hypothetical protein
MKSTFMVLVLVSGCYHNVYGEPDDTDSGAASDDSAVATDASPRGDAAPVRDANVRPVADAAVATDASVAADVQNAPDSGNAVGRDAADVSADAVVAADVVTTDTGATPVDSAVCTPHSEVCNGVDDDCNGAIDDGFGSTACGVGACRRTVPTCFGGTTQTCVPGAPIAEVCGNNADDNCNGIADDGCSVTPPPSSTPLRIEADPAVLATLPGIGTCDSGWVIRIWGSDPTAIESLPGAALTTTVTSSWTGYAAIGLKCGTGDSTRYIVWPGALIGHPAIEAGFRSILRGVEELARGPSRVCLYHGYVWSLFPVGRDQDGICP